MKSCVVFLGHRMTCSLIEDGVLILHNPIDIESLSSFLYQQEIDSLIFLCQGTPIPHQVDDSYTISHVYQGFSEFPVALKDTDMQFFIGLSTILNIKNVRIVSYLDYLADKFNVSTGSIVVTPYFDRYAVVAIKDGKVIDCVLVLEASLSQKITSFRQKYNAPVYNAEEENSKILKAYFKNFNQIPADQLFTLDYIPFCTSADCGLPLFNEPYCKGSSSTVAGADEVVIDNDITNDDDGLPNLEESGGESILDQDFQDTLKADVLADQQEVDRNLKTSKPLERARRPRRSTKHHLQFDSDDSQIDSTFLETGLKVASAIIFFLVVMSILFVVLFKQKALTMSNQVKFLNEQVQTAEYAQQCFSGDETKSPLYLVSTTTPYFDKVLSCSYTAGKLYIVMLSSDPSEEKHNEELLATSFTVKEKTLVGRFKPNDVTYEKVKYCVVPRE